MKCENTMIKFCAYKLLNILNKWIQILSKKSPQKIYKRFAVTFYPISILQSLHCENVNLKHVENHVLHLCPDTFS